MKTKLPPRNIAPQTSNYSKHILVALFAILTSLNCATGAQRVDASEDLVADTGELTRWELEKTAVAAAAEIAAYYGKNPNPDGIFVALLPTKNATSEIIATDFFDNTLVDELRKKGIFTVRTEDRSAALSEIEFSMTGMTDKPLSVGKMKSPNYFIKTDINENIFTSGGKKIVEQVINTELRHIETQLVVWSNRETYRKKVQSRDSMSW